MTEAAAAGPSKKSGFGRGLLLGLGAGGVVGLALGGALESHRGQAGSTGLSGQVAASAAAAPSAGADAPATVTADPPARPTLKAELGRPRDDFGSVQFPVTVENTGEAVRYLEATCAFYSKDGALVANGLENWTRVGAGEKASGTMTAQGATLAELDHYDCRAKSS